MEDIRLGLALGEGGPVLAVLGAGGNPGGSPWGPWWGALGSPGESLGEPWGSFGGTLKAALGEGALGPALGKPLGGTGGSPGQLGLIGGMIAGKHDTGELTSRMFGSPDRTFLRTSSKNKVVKKHQFLDFLKIIYGFANILDVRFPGRHGFANILDVRSPE